MDPVPCALCLDDYYCPGGAVDLTVACPWGKYSLPGAAAASSCFCPGNASSGPGADSMWACTCDPHFKWVEDMESVVRSLRGWRGMLQQHGDPVPSKLQFIDRCGELPGVHV